MVPPSKLFFGGHVHVEQFRLYGRAMMVGQSVVSVGDCRDCSTQLLLAIVVIEGVGERRPRKLNGP